MAKHSAISLLKELIHFLPLPGKTPKEWNDLTQVEASKPTIILVSGFGASERALSVMRKRLMRDDFNVFLIPMDWQGLSDGVRGLHRMAERLSSVILTLRKKKEYRKSKIFIVAHSAGGLVARHYIQQLGGSHYCDGLVTLATPHSGTWVAGLGFLTHLILKARCLFQMLPLSPFIKTLNLSPYPKGFRMVSIYSKDDFLCPESATQLPPNLHKEMQIQTVLLPRLSHSDFLMSKKSYEVIKRFLFSELDLPTGDSDIAHGNTA